jgi:dolichyl-phosphate-mannose-protein mannosyltransferase
MWTTNAGLTDRHTYDSRPDSWPLLRRGIVGALPLSFCND